MKKILYVVAFSLIFCSLEGCKNLDPLNPLKNNGNEENRSTSTVAPAPKPMPKFDDLPVIPGTSLRLLAKFEGAIEVGEQRSRPHPALRVTLDGESENLVAIEEQHLPNPSPIVTVPPGLRRRIAWRISLRDLAVAKLGEWNNGGEDLLYAVAGDSSVSLIYFEPFGRNPHRVIFKEKMAWSGTEDISSVTLYSQGDAGYLTPEGDAILWEFQGMPSDGKHLWSRDGSMKTLPTETQKQLESFGYYRGLRVEESGVPGTVLIEADYRGIGQGIERGILELDTGNFSAFPAELGNDNHAPSVRKWWVAKKEGRVCWQREDDKRNVFFIKLATPSISSLPLPEEIVLDGGSERGGFWGVTPAGETVLYRPQTAQLTQIKSENGWTFVQPVYEGKYGLWIRNDQKALGLSKIE